MCACCGPGAREVGQRRVRHMVGLQAQLRQVGQQLRDGRDGVVGHVDAVTHAQRGDARAQAGPQPGLGEVVAARQLQTHHALHLFKHNLEACVRDGGALEAHGFDTLLGERIVVNELTDVQVGDANQAEALEASCSKALQVHELLLATR